MSRARVNRPVIIAATTALVALQALIVPATAGDTRVIFIGSENVNGALTLSPASSGQLSAVDITVRNDGKQTLTKATLLIGVAPAAALPAGVVVSNVYGDDAAGCTVSDGTLSCDFASMSRGDGRDVTVVLTMGAAGTTTVEALVLVNELGNPNGSNQQKFPATGSVNVSETGCDNRATFVPPGQAAKIGTADATCGGQSTTLDIPANDNGNVVQVGEVDSTRCVPGRVCFGQESVASVNAGTQVEPFLTWTIVWPVVPKTYNPRDGIIHFLDNGTPDDPTDDFAQVIPFTKQTACSDTRIVDCVKSFTPVGDGGIMIVQTGTNGAMRG